MISERDFNYLYDNIHVLYFGIWLDKTKVRLNLTRDNFAQIDKESYTKVPAHKEILENWDDWKKQKETLKSDQTVQVYVCGEVAAPGVYQLKDGMRICDAVEAAGGLTKAASREYWNLAEKLSDGQMIYFPTEEEARERKASAEAAGATVEESDGRIDINTADAAQLVTIPGIGETRAAAILAYREKNGPFAKVEDIMQVSGIKSALFEKMKDYITIR